MGIQSTAGMIFAKYLNFRHSDGGTGAVDRSIVRSGYSCDGLAPAANAAIDHMRDWITGTHGRWVSMGVLSDGSYGIPQGIICGVPVTCADGKYQRVEGLPVDDFVRKMIDRTCDELRDELSTIS